ncbi:MAG: Omp28-related outer membrane protein [Vicingaceae bacterium]
MKKLLTTFSLIILFSLGVQAQYYFNIYGSPGQNPGGLNTSTEYPLGGGLPAGWTSILGPSVTTPSWSANQTIPFSFNFNGNPVTQYKVSSTGVLTFTTSATSVPGATKAALPSASIPDNSVCLWGLQTIGTNDNVVTQTFGSAPNRQHWVFFTSNALGGTGWSYWSIVLEEGSDNIYIVDQRHSGTTGGVSMGIQLNSTTAYSVGANVMPLAAADPTPVDNAYYEFIQGTAPADNVELAALGLNATEVIGNPISINGTLSNKGSNAINSVIVNWTADGGTTVNRDTLSLSLNTNSSVSFTHAVAWNPTTAGQNVTIDVWTQEPNGMTDPDPSNDSLSADVFTILGNTVQKVALMEQFTTAVCQFCPDGAWVTDQIDANYQNVAVTSVHSCFGTDAMTNSEASALCSTLGIGAAPTGMVDRKLFPTETDVAFGRGFGYPNWQNSTWSTRSLSQSQLGTAVDVSVTGNYNSSNRQLTANVTASMVDYIKPGDLVTVGLMLVEDSVTGSGNGYNQVNAYNGQAGHPYAGAGNPIVGYHHKRVLRDILPGTWGDPNVIPANYALNTNYTRNFTTTLPANYDPSKMYLIGIVSYYSTTNDLSGYEVLNVEKVKMSNLVTNTSELKKDVESLTIYPNPTADVSTLKFDLSSAKNVNLEVRDITGKLLQTENFGTMVKGRQSIQLDLANLAEGFYFVNLRLDNEVITKKISVVK